METSRATSFGAWADAYDDWRPTYPDAAVDWLVPPDGAQVVEVGAGTGKLTDRLVERGLDLDVVEPDGRMLRVINRRHPRLRTHQTGATNLPLGARLGRCGRGGGRMALVSEDGGRCGGGPRAPAQRLARLCVERSCAAARLGMAGTDGLTRACSLPTTLTLWTASDSRQATPSSGPSAGRGHSRRSSGEASCPRSRTSSCDPRTSATRHWTRPNNWWRRRARRPERPPCHSLTTRCASAGTQRQGPPAHRHSALTAAMSVCVTGGGSGPVRADQTVTLPPLLAPRRAAAGGGALCTISLRPSGA